MCYKFTPMYKKVLEKGFVSKLENDKFRFGLILKHISWPDYPYNDSIVMIVNRNKFKRRSIFVGKKKCNKRSSERKKGKETTQTCKKEKRETGKVKKEALIVDRNSIYGMLADRRGMLQVSLIRLKITNMPSDMYT